MNKSVASGKLKNKKTQDKKEASLECVGKPNPRLCRESY